MTVIVALSAAQRYASIRRSEDMGVGPERVTIHRLRSGRGAAEFGQRTGGEYSRAFGSEKFSAHARLSR
jgi:hypothetical protein